MLPGLSAERLAGVPGLSLAFPGPFFKEFVVHCGRDAEPVLNEVGRLGYHGGIAVGRWFPDMKDAILVAVTEKRSKVSHGPNAWNASNGKSFVFLKVCNQV